MAAWVGASQALKFRDGRCDAHARADSAVVPTVHRDGHGSTSAWLRPSENITGRVGPKKKVRFKSKRAFSSPLKIKDLKLAPRIPQKASPPGYRRRRVRRNRRNCHNRRHFGRNCGADIEDEYDQEETLFHSQPDGSWVVDARMSIFDIEDQLGIAISQEGEYDTIGGYIFDYAGSIPSKGFTIHQDDFDIEVIESSERTLEKVRIRPAKKKYRHSDDDEGNDEH